MQKIRAPKITTEIILKNLNNVVEHAEKCVQIIQMEWQAV